jgi:hypothetical protein
LAITGITRVLRFACAGGGTPAAWASRARFEFRGVLREIQRPTSPESKGKIESVVKYVKGNFLTCRIYHGISALNSEGLAWLDRTANRKIHETTKLIPDVVFAQEAGHLKPAPTLSHTNSNLNHFFEGKLKNESF